MKSSAARTPPKAAYKSPSNTTLANTQPKYPSRTNSGHLHQVYERNASPEQYDGLTDLERLKLSIEKELLRSSLTRQNPQSSISEVLTSYLRAEDRNHMYEREKLIERERLMTVLETEENLLTAQLLHQEKVHELERQETETLLMANASAGQLTVRQLENANEQASILKTQLRVSHAEHQHEINDLEAKRTLERSRTNKILQFEQEKADYFAKEIQRLTSELKEKNRQIEQLTREGIEKHKSLVQQKRIMEEQVLQANRHKEEHLEAKNSQFQKYEDQLKQQILDLKQANSDLQLKCSDTAEELAASKHEVELLGKKLQQLGGVVSTLKQQLRDSEVAHNEQLAKGLQERNRMLNEARKISKDPEQDNHILARHHESVVSELRRSFERETELLKKDILHLRVKLTEKDHEMQEVVSRYQPLLQAYQNPQSSQVNALAGRTSRSDLTLLQILTEQHRPRVLQ